MLRLFAPARRSSPAPLVLAALLIAACGQDGRIRGSSASTEGDATSSTASGPGGAGGMGGGGGAGGVGGSGPAKEPLPLRVLNWNVQNFLNDKDDSAAPEELIVSAAAYSSHRGEIGAVIAAMNPDVAVLQEVENVAVLEDLVATELGGAYSAIAVIDGNDLRGIDVGVISKVPIASLVSHKDDSFPLNGTQGPEYRYARDCLEIHLDYNGRKVVLLGVHFKAKDSDPTNAIKRLAEAQHTRAIAEGLEAGDGARAIAVLGDFNDTPGSPPYLAVLGEGDAQWQDAPTHVAAANRWTYDYQGKLELIDHQMSNDRLAAMLDPASVVIRHGADVEAASDHSPVMATYLVK